MDETLLRNFCTIVEKGSITRAAKVLHVSQSTLSRQLSSLEDELGQTLFLREKNGIVLTAHGVILYKHAYEILDIAQKIKDEMNANTSAVSGCVEIGVGETQSVALFSRAMANVKKRYPLVTFNVRVETKVDLLELFSKGHMDVILECALRNHANFNSLMLPVTEYYSLILRKDNPLARLDSIKPENLANEPLVMPRRYDNCGIFSWAGEYSDHLNIVANIDLPLNGRYLVEEGVGSLVTYAGNFRFSESDPLCCRLLDPPLEEQQGVLWRKNPTRQTQAFVNEIKRLCAHYANSCAPKPSEPKCTS